MLNHVVLMGRTTAKPEYKTVTRDEKPVECSTFTIAVDRDFDDETDFFKCAAFGSTAKFLDRHVEKGQQIAVEGRLKNYSWEDEGGDRHTITEIVAERIYFAGAKKQQAPENGQQEKNYLDE